jgi:GTP cyclohydrolase I
MTAQPTLTERLQLPAYARKDYSTEPVAAAVAQFLYALGVDEQDHTSDTPRRVAKAWAHMLGGYNEDPVVHLGPSKQFSAPDVPGLVIVTGIPVTSTCAHHLLPITGNATVAYLPKPGDQVVGLSKLSRVLEGYARRLQVQEQLGSQVVDAITTLEPYGSACIITAAHGCMTLRGVQQHSTLTTTVALGGLWRDSAGDPMAQEVLAQHRAAQPR